MYDVKYNRRREGNVSTDFHISGKFLVAFFQTVECFPQMASLKIQHKNRSNTMPLILIVLKPIVGLD